MDTTTSTFDEVKALVAETLGITDRLDSLNASTELLGSLPELESLAVAELLAEIEEQVLRLRNRLLPRHDGHVRDARHACRFRLTKTGREGAVAELPFQAGPGFARSAAAALG